ncbi:hypothetical protein [Burkholderia anthina]|uniref:hypothetical protein n=1 Tax=Burkholderia anthina TaxID=179879 RepID=UPI0012D8AF16|nr:hypothetical protein [Burkholderia anthina]
MKQRMGWLSRLLQSGGGILFAPMRATIIDQWISDYQVVRMHDIGAPGRASGRAGVARRRRISKAVMRDRFSSRCYFGKGIRRAVRVFRAIE